MRQGLTKGEWAGLMGWKHLSKSERKRRRAVLRRVSRLHCLSHTACQTLMSGIITRRQPVPIDSTLHANKHSLRTGGQHPDRDISLASPRHLPSHSEFTPRPVAEKRRNLPLLKPSLLLSAVPFASSVHSIRSACQLLLYPTPGCQPVSILLYISTTLSPKREENST